MFRLMASVAATGWVGRFPSSSAQDALLADYLEQAERFGAPPMSSAAIGAALGIVRREEGGEGEPN